jgi:hypothetical protein
LGCGHPGFEVTSVQMPLDPPSLPIGVTLPTGQFIDLGDLRAAAGQVNVDVALRRATLDARGLPALSGGQLGVGLRYRLWLRDAFAWPYYVGEVGVDSVGRAAMRAIFSSSSGVPVADVREALLVLWYDDTPTVVAEPVQIIKGGGLHPEHEGRPGWVLTGKATDLPATASPLPGGHQH